MGPDMVPLIDLLAAFGRPAVELVFQRGIFGKTIGPGKVRRGLKLNVVGSLYDGRQASRLTTVGLPIRGRETALRGSREEGKR